MRMNETHTCFSVTPSSSIRIRFFMSWSWQQLSSISMGFLTCRSFATASREDAQMTHFSEGPDCDLLILFFIALQTHLKSCWNWIYSHLSLLLCFWFANLVCVLVDFLFGSFLLQWSSINWPLNYRGNLPTGTMSFNNYEAWSLHCRVRTKWDFNQNLIHITMVTS